MDTKLKKYLEKQGIKYDIKEHRKVYTAFDEAETLASASRQKSGKRLNAKEIAKTVLLKIDNSLAIAVVPAAKNVDLQKIKTKLKAKKISMAKEADIAKTLKTKIGLLHPFAEVYKIEIMLVDNAILKLNKIIASAGSYTESIIITPANFKKAQKNIITGPFGKSK